MAFRGKFWLEEIPGRAFAFALAVFSLISVFFVYSFFNRGFFEFISLEVDLIEESEADEKPAAGKTLEKFHRGAAVKVYSNPQRCLEEGLINEEAEENEDADQAELRENEPERIVATADAAKKKPVPKRSFPSSITKYGIVFHPPAQYKKDGKGRMVCIHKNDKPKVSGQGKPVHIDMECCLDPDEIPNPFCHYPADKYGKLLEDFERKREKMLRRFDQERGL